jgi:signal transduction histidine kinase
MFKVAARTVLELGSELISSDAIAIYELVKNAIDARSKDGVTIELSISLRHSHYIDLLARVSDACDLRKEEHWPASTTARTLAELKAEIKSQIQASCPAQVRGDIVNKIDSAATLNALRGQLTELYKTTNWIEIRDTGLGMSKDDLLNSYLVIGTPSRRHSLERELNGTAVKTTYLGEKGVGRLSVMRLGSLLSIRTATEQDKYFNNLEVDWSEFEDLDKMIEDITISPTTGSKKIPADYSGTVIRISDLTASWSKRAILEVATWDLARIADPFSRSKRRFRIAIIFNGERVEIPRLEQSLLDLCQARASGTYSIANGKPALEINLWCGDLGKGNPPAQRRIYLEKIDLRSITKDTDSEISDRALTTIGPFSFELYWYNRRLMKGVDSIGDRKHLLRLLEQWCGIMLFRDGYRVFPYGDDDNDWLGLDRRAFASGGYKLNKTQFVGRVSISRIANSQLIDQTNREGLKDCDEKSVLLEVMQFVIQNRMRFFLDEVERNHKSLTVDFEMSEHHVKTLRGRALTSIRALEQRHSEERPTLHQLTTIIEEMNDYFLAAKERAEQIEDERDRMVQLAGIGLMLEIVAHELARSTEHTIEILDNAPVGSGAGELSSVFRTLRDEMNTMNKRLRVLDPLSISGRQRKETFDFGELVGEVLAGHAAQFRRHHVHATVKLQSGVSRVMVTGVRGMYVQILENLVQNSVYWMALKRADEADYKPSITIRLGPFPTLMEFHDNGPGVQASLQEEVFKAFFSTKGKSRRQGLGLYIARDCAEHNGASLYLSPECDVQAGRLNTFILELQEAK